jgi:hypothetical protein
MTTSNDNWLHFITDCITELCKYDVKIELSNSDNVYIQEENIRVNGYWDDSNENHLVFACAIGKPIKKWGPIFAHEYCHFLQWKDKDQLWYDYQSISVDENYKIYHNLPIEKDRLEFCLNTYRDVELDCEKRTVKLLKKYKVPVDITEYIRGANAYVHFYNYIKRYRKWYPPKKMPYACRALHRLASPTFEENYDEIPKHMVKAYERYYPVKRKSNILD